MRAREFCTNNINESLNQPYKLIGWDDESYDDEITTWAALPDGTYLEILFDRGESEDWLVDFKRGDSMQKTGQGDAQRIFATVLEAIKQFIKKYDPDKLSFSAIKMGDPTGSRRSLYDTLAKRYAASLGYSFKAMDDTFDRNYVFKKIRRDMEEGLDQPYRLSWSSLDEGLSVEDKMIIFEEYFTKGNLTESIDKDKKEYFLSLTELSDAPTKNKMYIVAPLALVGNRTIILDKPSYMEFLGQGSGGLVFENINGRKTYPPKTMRDLSVFNTFTFSSADKYDKFRTALSLKFDSHLPNIDIEENGQQGVTESVGEDDVDQITNDFIKHYEDDPLSVFMQAKASYLYAVERAKDFSNKADDLYRSHGDMSREEFQNTVMKYFGKHLRNNGFPRHASKDWSDAEHQLRDELMNSDQPGVAESDDDDSKKLKGFHQSLGNAVRGHVSQMQANMAILKAQHPDTWLWEPGDIVYSAETGRTYEIVGPWLDNRGTAKYLYRGNDEEKGTFVADRAHQTLKKISGKQGVAENFADGRNPGRKGLSRRVGIPQKATLGQLEKIARGSTGERRRMAQWQLNMRRGRNKKK